MLAKQQGFEVFVSDSGLIKKNYKTDLLNNEISFEEGFHTEEKVLNATLILKSPGIPEKNEMV